MRSQSGKKSPSRQIVGQLIVMALFFVLDVCLLGQGVVASVGAVIAVGFVLVRKGEPNRLARICAWTALIPLVWGSLWLQHRLAEQRAEKIVEAIRAFRCDRNVYPENLEELTPKYFAAIPRSMPFRLLFGEYYYHVDAKRSFDAELVYIVVPPFQTRGYSFRLNRWGGVD